MARVYNARIPNVPWLDRLVSRATNLRCAFRVHTPQGITDFGDGRPEFELHIHNDRGMRALRSLNELRIADSYIRGDLDVEGDFIRAMWLRGALSDRNVWLKLWRRLEPLLLGREKLNPTWIAKHYDSQNIQLFATDEEYHAYRPAFTSATTSRSRRARTASTSSRSIH